MHDKKDTVYTFNAKILIAEIAKIDSPNIRYIKKNTL